MAMAITMPFMVVVINGMVIG